MQNSAVITVQVAGQGYRVTAGASIREILGQIYVDEHCVVGAALNNHLVSIDTTVYGDCIVEPISAGQREGQGIIRRSVAHMFHYIMRERFPDMKVFIGQSLLGGYFYEVYDPEVNLPRVAHELTVQLGVLAAENRTFDRSMVTVEAAAARVDDPYGCKARLLAAWAHPIVPLISLDGFHDIEHGPYAPSTRCAAGARVEAHPAGLILMFPGDIKTSPLRTHAESGNRLLKAYRETRDWNQLIGVTTVGDLNAAVLEGRIGDVIKLSEALHEKKLAEVADAISVRRDVLKLICIAGPSSSGKTTFLNRLSVQLRVNGITPVPVSLDDYYLDRERTPRDEHGEYDFEALEALDLDLLGEHLSALVQGRPVQIPSFDFQQGRRTPREEWRTAQLGPNQVLLIEGIHGLNPGLAEGVDDGVRYRIFVSALTQLVIDENNRIFTSDSRLLRRLVRDRRYRGTLACDTIARWASVRRGEEKHIFPYQENSDVMFNSTLLYEAAVLKTLAWRYLLEIPRTHPSRVVGYQLLRFLELFVPILPDTVPANSVLREFIGTGSLV